MRLFRLGRIVFAIALCLLPINVAADSIPTGERAHGSAVIEPAYDDSTGQVIYLLTPQRLAPLSPNNPINNVNPHAVAPLDLILYPPGTPGNFNCMGAAPGNCPDHAGTVAGLATSLFPGVYGSDPAAVPGHDHLVGVPRTGGEFNVPRRLYPRFFPPQDALDPINTLAQHPPPWASGGIAAFQSGMGLDTGITFVCAVVSKSSYAAGAPL